MVCEMSVKPGEVELSRSLSGFEVIQGEQDMGLNEKQIEVMVETVRKEQIPLI